MKYIYCYPLFDERKCSHRFAFQLAETFQKNNLKLERFDYQGTGEAEGNFYDVTTDSLTRDICKIADKNNVCLIGCRFGATTAFNFCCQGGYHKQASIDKLILIEPIIDGRSYASYLLKKQQLKDTMSGNVNLSPGEDDFINLEGYKTTIKFFEQIKNVNLIEDANKITAETVAIIQISISGKINPKYDTLVQHLKKNNITTDIIPFKSQPFWERLPVNDYTAVTEKILEYCQ